MELSVRAMRLYFVLAFAAAQMAAGQEHNPPAKPLAAAATSQPPPARAYNPDLFSVLRAIRESEIQQILELTETQQRELSTIQSSWQEKFAQYEAKPRADRDLTMLRSVLDEHVTRARDVLSSDQYDQLTRLNAARLSRRRTFLHVMDVRDDKELSLNKRQQEKLDSCYERWLRDASAATKEVSNRSLGFRNVSFLVGSRFSENWDRVNRPLFANTLTAEQQARFDQIGLRLLVFSIKERVFLTAQVRDTLGLTLDQQNAIREQATATITARFDGYYRAIKMLSEEQREKWQSSLGTPTKHPFELRFSRRQEDPKAP